MAAVLLVILIYGILFLDLYKQGLKNSEHTMYFTSRKVASHKADQIIVGLYFCKLQCN